MQPNSENDKKSFFQAITSLIISAPTYTTLNLQNIKFKEFHSISRFTDYALRGLALAIKANMTLKKFEFDYLYRDSNTTDAWSHVGIGAIGQALANHPTLEEVHLTLKQHMTYLEMCALFQILTGNAKIKKLLLKTDRISDDLLKSLGEALAKNKTLESITILTENQYYEEENKQDALMTFAEGFAGKSLQSLVLILRLNDSSIEILSKHLSKINTLDTMALIRCNATHVCMKSVAEILKKNKGLKVLDLSHNSLGSAGIKSLADAMPNLPQLTVLSLNGTNFDAEALRCLGKIWRKHHLKIRIFEIYNDMESAYNDDYIDAVKEIIENNEYLIELNMGDKHFNKEHFSRLENLLQDPKRCRLGKFVFGQFYDSELGNTLVEIQNKNPHIVKLVPARVPGSLSNAWKASSAIHKTSQQNFVEYVISFINICFSPSLGVDKQPLSLIPLEVLKLILLQVTPETFGKNPEEMSQCIGLIFNNFSNRRKLISKKEYSPEEVKSNPERVKAWWSLSPQVKNAIPIFRKPIMEDSEIEAESHQGMKKSIGEGQAPTKCIIQ